MLRQSKNKSMLVRGMMIMTCLSLVKGNEVIVPEEDTGVIVIDVRKQLLQSIVCQPAWPCIPKNCSASKAAAKGSNKRCQ